MLYYDITFKKGDQMKSQGKMKRVNISLDKPTHDLLVQLANEGGYETVSRAVRSLVKKYAKHELDPFNETLRSETTAMGEGGYKITR
jgi:Arc/MetJ-type ribon-helix-helix transcriptional regulator